ncbi:hypothetical protein FRC11_002696 [Ceratobasidium sp. 423]|nr:hypothetical protein FRC11_002696 [Ceratobasidium sp. 423]
MKVQIALTPDEGPSVFASSDSGPSCASPSGAQPPSTGPLKAGSSGAGLSGCKTCLLTANMTRSAPLPEPSAWATAGMDEDPKPSKRAHSDSSSGKGKGKQKASAPDKLAMNAPASSSHNSAVWVSHHKSMQAVNSQVDPAGTSQGAQPHDSAHLTLQAGVHRSFPPPTSSPVTPLMDWTTQPLTQVTPSTPPTSLEVRDNGRAEEQVSEIKAELSKAQDLLTQVRSRGTASLVTPTGAVASTGPPTSTVQGERLIQGATTLVQHAVEVLRHIIGHQVKLDLPTAGQVDGGSQPGVAPPAVSTATLQAPVIVGLSMQQEDQGPERNL